MSADRGGAYRHRLLGAWIAIGLSGCVPAPRQPLLTPRTRAPAFQAFRTRIIGAQLPSGNWPPTHWWRTFRDPVLTHLIHVGLAANNSLQAALADARASRAAARAVGGAIGPSLAASGAVQRQRASASGLIPPPFAGQTFDYGQVGLTAGYDLSWWDRRHAALQVAIGAARTAAATAAETRLLVSTEIAADYFALAEAAAARRTAWARVRIRTHLLALIRDRLHAGITSAVRYDAANNALASAHAAAATASLRVTRARLALAAVLGRGPGYALRIPLPPTLAIPRLAIPRHIPLDLLARRPDIRVRYWAVLAAAAGIHEARARYYPNISLDANFAYQSITLGRLLAPANITAAIGPALHLPLFDAEARRANLSASRARYDAACARYNARIVYASAHVAQALAALVTAITELRDARAGTAAARSGLDLALARFRAGVYGAVPTRESGLTMLRARRELDTAHARVLLADVAVIRALGGGYHAAPRGGA